MLVFLNRKSQKVCEHLVIFGINIAEPSQSTIYKEKINAAENIKKIQETMKNEEGYLHFDGKN